MKSVKEGNLSSGDILEEFTWHPTEERILIKDVFSNGIKNYTVYYVSKEYILIENSTGNYSEKYVYQDGVLVGQIDTDGNKKAVHNDHLGSVSLITDSSGNVAENTFYSPFGEILQGGDKSRFDYESKEFDSLTGDYDFHFRKFKPNIPIFNQPDTLIQNVYDPQSLNRYMFERGNPYKIKDDDGHFWNVVVAGAIGAIGGFVTYLGTHDEFEWKDALLYSGAGALEGASTQFTIFGAGLGGMGGQAIRNYVDGKESSEGVVESGITSALSFKIIKNYLPRPRIHLIKHLSSYFTTKTGLTFIANELTEQGSNTVGNIVANLIQKSYSNMQMSNQNPTDNYLRYQAYFEEKKSNSDRDSRRGIGGCGCGSWGDLREIAENNPNNTADEILEEWRRLNG